MTKTLLVVWHSNTGGTRAMAEAAAEAAKGQGVRVRLLHAAEAGPEDVLGAEGFIFATPETLAAIAGPMKDFFDRCYYAALGRIEGRPYGLMVCAGSDGSNAARQVARIATGWRLRAVVETLVVCTNAQTPEAILAAKAIDSGELARCAELGATLAAGMEIGAF
jgi:multimeric flavodoxin WrbA